MGSNEEEAKTQAESIVNLELRMAEVTMPEDERRDEKVICDFLDANLNGHGKI